MNKSILNLWLAFAVVLLSTSVVKCANFFSIEIRNEPNIQINRIIQDLVIKSETSDVATLSVAPLDMYIINLQNPNIKIPVHNLSVASGVTPHQLNYGKSTILADNISLNSQEYVKVVLNDIGYLRAGTYSTRLEFTKNSNGESISNTYMLNVDVPKEQEIYSDMSDVRIKIDGSKVFTSNLTATNESNPKINIKSNVPWNLYLDTTGASKLNNEYYFQVRSKSPGVDEFEASKIQLEPNKKYWLASGDITKLSPAALYIEYSQKNTGKYSAPGISNVAFKYVIEEKKP